MKQRLRKPVLLRPVQLRPLLLGTVTIAAVVLQGCVVAALPAGAAAVVARNKVVRDGKRKRAETDASRQAEHATTAEPPKPTTPPATMQFLYGSGEALALSAQAYNALTVRIRASADYRQLNFPVASLVLAPGSTLEAPNFVPCGQKPLAIVLDIDETSVLNLGYEEDEARRGLAYDEERWSRWEATGGDDVAAVPGVIDALRAARLAGVAAIFISNRSALNAEATQRMLDGAGLGVTIPGDTLLLRAEDSPGGKDARRDQIAARYCVIAMVGDQLGDFSDLFNAPDLTPAARRAAAGNEQFRPLWGAGWYMLPNPVYGTAPKGGFDEIFPLDKRWEDPAAQGAK